MSPIPKRFANPLAFSQDRLRSTAVIVLLAALYFGLGLQSLHADGSSGIITPSCFLAEGVALAASIGLGPWVWPGIFLGQLWLALHMAVPWQAALVIAVTNSLEAVIGSLLFRRFGLRPDLPGLRDLTGLLILIFFVLQPFSATMGTVALAWGGGVVDPDLPSGWLNWWIGNAMGQALLTPLLLSGLVGQRRLGQSILHVLLALLVVTPAAWMAFQLIRPTGTSVLLVVFTPLLVLVAVGLGLPGATAGGLGLTLTAQSMTRLGYGPFVENGLVQILDLNTFVLGLSLTAEFLAVLLTERRRLEEQLRRFAFLDPLTQLPNRRLFLERLAGAEQLSQRNGSWAALILLDLDRFKPLNDTHGHEAGDQLLIEVARRLELCLQGSGLAARLGGDEFALILENLGPDEPIARRQAQAVAETIAARLCAPYALGSVLHRCSASFGIRLFRGAGQDSQQLLRDADRAMYQSKKRWTQEP